jgi:L-ascorbate metabolism protein UlaG (beta-lactamase superfamily)
MHITLDWLGVSTYRLKIDDLVIFLDAYLDRVPAAPKVGLSASQVDRAHFILVGHSHFDHLWGAERIARNTGAVVIGSYETARAMSQEEVPESQIMAVAGGERVRLSDRVTVRVFPSQHSCIWAKNASLADEACLGDQGLTLQERHANMEKRSFRRRPDDRPGAAEMQAHLRESDQHVRSDGGALAYLIETPEGSILWKDTSGHWTGILRDLRPDLALLAAAGRGNVDGEPIQGTLAQFLAREVDLLRPRQVALCHHDNWMPPFTRGTDIKPIQADVARHFPGVELLDMGYLEDRPVLRRG